MRISHRKKFQQAFQKQLEQQLRAQVHQMELMRNGGTNGTVTNSAVRDSPSRGGPGAAHGLPPNMMPPPYHNFNMDPRALASLMHNTHMAQFGMSPMDGHAAAMMNAFEQRNALEQRMLGISYHHDYLKTISSSVLCNKAKVVCCTIMECGSAKQFFFFTFV